MQDHQDVIEKLLSKGAKCIRREAELVHFLRKKRQQEAEKARQLQEAARQQQQDERLALQRQELARQRQQEEALAAQCKFELAQRVFDVQNRVAAAMSAPLPKRDEMTKWFEEGRLPCGFANQLCWNPVLTQMESFELKLATKRSAIAEVQSQKQKAAQHVQVTWHKIEELQRKLDRFLTAEEKHTQDETTLQAELKEWEQLGLSSWTDFVRSAAQIEADLMAQLDKQLDHNKGDLLALHEEGGPKLSLLLNCFGADARTIQALADLSSLDLSCCQQVELQQLVQELPREQQTVAFYTQERLIHGKIPFSQHECAACDCETPEEMANFFQENGLNHITPALISRTGASGHGALLFLTPLELCLSDMSQKRILNRILMNHRHL